MESGCFDALKSLPHRVLFEIKKICESREGGLNGISEIRLMRGHGSHITVRGEKIRLVSSVSAEDMLSTVTALCGGAVYAHRDTIVDGYISTAGGVRVGVCGDAKYESDKLIGVSEINALIYRFPTVQSSLSDQLYEAFAAAERGMLVYSGVGGGKTTALRTLSARLARENSGIRIVVVDERCEFFADEAQRLGIALLRGYRRAHGMEIALRTLSADVIVVDEIGSRVESEGIRESLLSGVRFLASAHASSLDELITRDGVTPFIEYGVFDVFFGIKSNAGVYTCDVERKECLKL